MPFDPWQLALVAVSGFVGFLIKKWWPNQPTPTPLPVPVPPVPTPFPVPTPTPLPVPSDLTTLIYQLLWQLLRNKFPDLPPLAANQPPNAEQLSALAQTLAKEQK